MSYEAIDLIAGKLTPKFIISHEPLQSAIPLLLDHSERFLIVVKDEQTKTPIGLLSSDSIVNAMRNFGDGIEEMQTIDVADKIATYPEDAEVADFYEDLQKYGTIAIVNDLGNLINTITINDTSNHFHALAYDMILLEDIEKSLRDHIEAAYTDPQTMEVNGKQLKSAIEQVLGRKKPFNHLTLSESTRLFCHPRTWSNYGKKHFSVTPKALTNLLDIVRQIRNPWAHFRSNPTPAQRRQLKFAQQWFKRNDPVFPVTAIAPLKIPQPIKSEKTDAPVSEFTASFIIEETEENDSKYAKLAIFLGNQPKETQQLQMRFDEIEKVLGFDLPNSAREHRAWWANDTVGHVHSKQWLDVDWRVASVNMSSQTIRFDRIKERQKAYIDFFSTLINDLSQEKSFGNLEVLPHGGNWHWTGGVSLSNKTLGFFAYSFPRGGIFRIELYIDSGDQTLNKQLFDGLLAQKEAIETEIGHELSWQRLDNRRASRVAHNYKAQITDSAEALASLRKKAVPAMVNFVKIIQPRVEAIGKEI